MAIVNVNVLNIVVGHQCVVVQKVVNGDDRGTDPYMVYANGSFIRSAKTIYEASSYASAAMNGFIHEYVSEVNKL